jgi:hypothetical protein
MLRRAQVPEKEFGRQHIKEKHGLNSPAYEQPVVPW